MSLAAAYYAMRAGGGRNKSCQYDKDNFFIYTWQLYSHTRNPNDNKPTRTSESCGFYR